MPKPEPETIALVRIDGDDLDWTSAIDSLTDGEIAQWAADRIAAADFTEDTVREAEVVIRWTTGSAITRAVETSKAPPTYDDWLDADNIDDGPLVERGERVTDAMKAKLRGLLT